MSKDTSSPNYYSAQGSHMYLEYRGYDDRASRAAFKKWWNQNTSANAPERPVDVLAAKVTDLEAKLQLADERTFFLTSELAQANARLGITDYRTQP